MPITDPAMSELTRKTRALNIEEMNDALMRTPAHPYFHDYGNVDHSKTRVEFRSDSRCVTTVEQVMGAPFKPAAVPEWRHFSTSMNKVAQGDVTAFADATAAFVARSIAPTTCTCPAPHPPSARFCPRCGGAVRRPFLRRQICTVGEALGWTFAAASTIAIVAYIRVALRVIFQ